VQLNSQLQERPLFAHLQEEIEAAVFEVERQQVELAVWEKASLEVLSVRLSTSPFVSALAPLVVMAWEGGTSRAGFWVKK
jgi:hypothetical protein